MLDFFCCKFLIHLSSKKCSFLALTCNICTQSLKIFITLLLAHTMHTSSKFLVVNVYQNYGKFCCNIMYDILINYMKLCHIAKEKQKAAIIFTMCVQRWKCFKSTDSVMQVSFLFSQDRSKTDNSKYF